MKTPIDSNPAVAEKVFGAEILLSNLLRTGVICSLLFIVTGLVLVYVGHPEYMSSPDAYQRLTHPGEAPEFSFGAVLAGALEGHGESVITIGFLILAFTPVLRVALSLVVFALQKDRIFTLITMAVLVILLSSFFLGKAAH